NHARDDASRRFDAHVGRRHAIVWTYARLHLSLRARLRHRLSFRAQRRRNFRLSHHDVAFGSTVWWRQRPVRQHLVGRHSSRRCASRGARTTVEKLPDAAAEQGSQQRLTMRCGQPRCISIHVYEVRPRKDHRGVDLLSDVLPFGRLWYDTPDNAIGYAMHYSRSHDAVIRVYDAAGNVIETHRRKGDFKEW